MDELDHSEEPLFKIPVSFILLNIVKAKWTLSHHLANTCLTVPISNTQTELWTKDSVVRMTTHVSEIFAEICFGILNKVAGSYRNTELIKQ